MSLRGVPSPETQCQMPGIALGLSRHVLCYLAYFFSAGFSTGLGYPTVWASTTF